MRIVSLLASTTEIVCALGAGSMLVGRSHECDNPHWVSALPACTSPAFDVSLPSGAIDAEVRRRLKAGLPLYHVDAARIEALRPDLLLTQSHCEVCAVTPEDVTRSGACLANVRQIAVSAGCLEEIFGSVAVIAEALALEEQGRLLVHRERERLRAVRRQSSRFRRRSVVMLEWTDPLFAMGNWGPELLEIANGELLIGRRGEYSALLAPETLCAADPECIIVAPCGFDLGRSLAEGGRLARHPWWGELRAVREGNVFFADGNLFFNRSGMTMAATAEMIAEMLHG